MCRRADRIQGPRRIRATALAALVVLAAGPSQLGAGTPRPTLAQAAPGDADDALSQYLERHRLKRLLAEHLERELAAATSPEERARLVERLADVYPDLLVAEEDPARRDELVSRSTAFLERESPKQGDALRLALLRARYRAASRVAEDHRSALVEPERIADAMASLEGVERELAEVRRRFELRLRDLEKRGERTDGLEGERVQDRADTVRGQVQESYGLEAWSRYYRSILADDPRLAGSAQPIFAKLLETGKEYPTPEDVSLDLRSNDFFANTILGMALSLSRTEGFVSVMSWLSLLDVPQVGEAMRRQLPAWKLVVAIECGEWSAAREVVKAFPADAPSAWLRVAAVGGLRRGKGARDATVLASEAITSLAARRELGQIADLARRFGEEAIGQRGFASRYVRGVLAYEAARKDNEEKRVAEARSGFEGAAKLLESALREPDLSEFAEAATACRSLAGWSRYERGEFAEAKVLFAAAVESSEGRDEEAEWMALVCVEKLAASQAEGSERRAALAQELRQRVDAFIGHHPASSRMPQVLLRRTTLVETPQREDLERLLTGSGASEEVRRQAVGSYYRLFRASSGAERASVGRRFLDLTKSMSPVPRQSGSAEGSFDGLPGASLTVARQVLDVALSADIADVTYAGAVLSKIDELANAKRLDVAGVAIELTVRRIQHDLASDRLVKALERLTGLEAINDDEGRRALDIARRHVFRFASGHVRAGTRTPNSDRGAVVDAAIRSGERILEVAAKAAGSVEAALADGANDSMAMTTLQAMAEAAVAGGHKEIAERGLTLAKSLLGKRPKDPIVLEHVATLATVTGDNERALDSLRQLIAGSSERSDRWFRAKVMFLELLAKIDTTRARAVFAQHRQLHPDLGPEPWRGRLRELERSLGVGEVGGERPPASEPASAPASQPASQPSGTPEPAKGDAPFTARLPHSYNGVGSA